MKQSNWILGIGVLVAVILIISSLLLNRNDESSNNAHEPVKTEKKNRILNIVTKPIKNISTEIFLYR